MQNNKCMYNFNHIYFVVYAFHSIINRILVYFTFYFLPFKGNAKIPNIILSVADVNIIEKLHRRYVTLNQFLERIQVFL